MVVTHKDANKFIFLPLVAYSLAEEIIMLLQNQRNIKTWVHAWWLVV